jgi:hypothetical protein
MTVSPLSADDIRRLFEELASELDAQGIRAEIFLVGGAAIALCIDGRRATRDLDAVFLPTDAVRRGAAKVAEREGLEPDWLNDAVKGFLPGPDPQSVRYFEAPGLLVDVASPEYLLAMKLFSSRVETDADDIALLYRAVGLHTVDEGLALVERGVKRPSERQWRPGSRWEGEPPLVRSRVDGSRWCRPWLSRGRSAGGRQPCCPTPPSEYRVDRGEIEGSGRPGQGVAPL